MANILEPGDVVAGRYKVLSVLGMGGQGQVCKVRKLGPATWEKLVALKVMLPTSIGEDRHAAERAFVREAQIAAKLSHRNIVSVNEFGVDRDGLLLFLEMPLIHGVDLRAVLRASQGYRLPVDLSLYIVGEMLIGLDFAHRHAVIYQDVKDSNVLVSYDGAIFLTDFGIARLQYTAPTQMVVKGTPGYVAPELFDGKTPASVRADLFGVGVLAYRMLTGHALFQATDLRQAATIVRTSKVPPLSDFGVKAPRGLEQHLRRLLSVDPTERPASAAETRALLLGVPGLRLGTAEDLTAYLRSIGITPPAEENTMRADTGAGNLSPVAGPPTLRAPDLDATRQERHTQGRREKPSDGVPIPLDEPAPTDVDTPAPVPGSGRTFRMWGPQRAMLQAAATTRDPIDDLRDDADAHTAQNPAGPIVPRSPEAVPRSRRKVILVSIAVLGIVGTALVGVVALSGNASRGNPTNPAPLDRQRAMPPQPHLVPATTVDAGAARTAITVHDAAPTRIEAPRDGDDTPTEPTRRSRRSIRSDRKPTEDPSLGEPANADPVETDGDFKQPW